jgi:hypothetical protein
MEFKIEQTSSHIKITLDGLDITKACQRINFEADAWNRNTTVHLDLRVDSVEITALAERDVTIMVNVPHETETALQAIGWIKAGDRTTYTVPREELSA